MIAALLTALFRTSVYGVYILIVLYAHRWIRRQSPLLANIFAAGLVGRALLGTALYAISFFELPIFSNLQLGAGFWILGRDALWYFQSAAQAAVVGLSTIQDGSASPEFVRLLAVWMKLFGVSPASAVLLNVACYVCAAALVVHFGNSVRVSACALLALTCSPALLIFGTQPLKDTVCVLLVLVAGVGARLWVDGLVAARWRGSGATGSFQRLPRRSLRQLGAGAALLALATYGFGGIRAYFGLFLLLTVALMVSSTVFVSRRQPIRGTALSAGMLLVLLVWLSYAAGAGLYSGAYSQALRLPVSPWDVLSRLDDVRAAFTRSGGGTTLVGDDERTQAQAATTGRVPSSVTAPVDDIVTIPAATRVKRLAMGLAALFIPISLMQALSLTTFEGGRGLLLITDIDTIFVDVVLCASLIILIAGRPTPASGPVMLFLLALAIVTTLSMAYIVTNFGTLFRLRLMAVAPLWFLPALVSGRADARAAAAYVQTS